MFKGDVAKLNQSTFIKEAPCKVPCCMDIEKRRLFTVSALSVLVRVHSPTSIKYRVTLSSKINMRHEMKDVHLVLIFSSNS